LAPVLFRSACADDARTVSGIYAQSWPNSVRHVASRPLIDALLRERSEPFWRESIEELGIGFEVAMDGSRAVAFCGWMSRAARSGELKWLFVTPESQRGGVGSALHDRAVRAMVDAGIAEGCLWAVPRNGPAERFYRHKGWRATEELIYVPTRAGEFPLRKWICSLPLRGLSLRGR
jgi:GNAT superfamily N-acetyltransferase